MGFFDKIKKGLSKTRDSIMGGVDNVLKSFVKVDEELFEELEDALIMADLGVRSSEEIIERLRERVKEGRIKDAEEVRAELRTIITEMLSTCDNRLKLETKPSVILVVGVNGVGKTTSIAKLAAKFKYEGKKVLLGAADTFRAAAIDQLQIWADRVGVELVKHDEGADPAAVVFDTVRAGKSRGADLIICDTAGRLHNKKNLMNELSKISRVIDRELPDADRETLLVIDATTGQNGVQQARDFGESCELTGIILTKLDGTAKGGIVVAITNELAVPVKFVGVGEQMDDLQDFAPEEFAAALFDGGESDE